MTHMSLTVHSQCRFKAGEMSQSSDMLIDPHVQNQRSPPTSKQTNLQQPHQWQEWHNEDNESTSLTSSLLLSAPVKHGWSIEIPSADLHCFQKQLKCKSDTICAKVWVVKYWLEPLSAFEIWLLQMLKTSEVQDLRNYRHCGHSCQWVCTCPNSLKDWKKNFCGAAGT